MPACPELQYKNVTAGAWECCKKAVSEYVKIDSNAGEASSRGVTVKWNYVSAAQILSLQCTGKPIFVSCGYVNNTIDEAVKACLPK